MQLHITTNNIGKLVETTFEKCSREGVITTTEREAVRNINGHSSATTERYYLKLDRCADAVNGRSAFEKVLNNVGLDYNPNRPDCESNWPAEETTDYRPWGTMHPSFNKVSKSMCQRAIWSDDELNYLGRWIDKFGTDNSCRVARCLHHIYQDESATPIFHQIHVLNSGRLRAGFDRLAKIKQSTIQQTQFV